jgi:hypothetical protein
MTKYSCLGEKGDFMSATLTLPIDVELQGLLAQKAAQGVNIETFAVEAIKRAARRPAISDEFAEVRADFVPSGISEEELQRDNEQALAEMKVTDAAPPSVSPARLQTFLQVMAAGATSAPVLPQAANERAFYYEGQE